jgi:TctA family transporter
MKKENAIILFGLLIFLTQFLGIPGSLKTLCTIFFGLFVAVLGIFVRSDFKRIASGKGKHTDAFVENAVPIHAEGA